MHPSSSPNRFVKPGSGRLIRRRNRTLVTSIAAAGLMLLLLVRATQARQTPRELAAKGDKSWNEKSYSDAADAYTKALDADPRLPERPEMKLRILIANIRASRWDAALSESKTYQKEYRGTVFEGLGMQWRARLYSTVEHNGYSVGKRKFHGTDFPESNDKVTPEAYDFETEDNQEAELSFEKCRTLLDQSRKSSLPAEMRARAAEAEMENDFDIIARAADEDDSEKFRPDRTDWSIDLHQPLDFHWPIARQTMYLYREIEAIDAESSASNHHNTVLASLGIATYIVKLRTSGNWSVPDKRHPGQQIRIFIPYVKEEPIALLDETVRKYPADPEADRLAFTAARWRDQSGDSGHAAAAYRLCISDYPKGRWLSDAKKNLDLLTTPSLTVNTGAFTRPGSRLVLRLTSRNIGIVKFTAYRVHPEKLFGHSSYKNKGGNELHPPFTDISHHFSTHDEQERYHKEKIAEWTATTSNTGLNNLAKDAVTTPLDTLGAYIIEARSADHPEIGTDTLAIVSDMAIVQKLDLDSVLCYAADSKSGKPMPGVNLSIWEPRRAEPDAERDAVYASGLTDSSGTFHAALPQPVDASDERINVIRSAETFAWAGGNRYAVSAPVTYGFGKQPRGESSYRGYITLDRPLYRPGQSVNYRLLLTKGSPQQYSVAPNKAVLITVDGPKGELQHIVEHTNASGDVSGSFTLPTGADTGGYTLTAGHPEDRKVSADVIYAQHAFRVEEYKKPEFAVTVTADKSTVRVGEKLSVTVNAAYFFGAPVANAKVHYKVYRKPVVHAFAFKPRVEWFPEESNPEDQYNRARDNIDTNYWGDPNSVYREGDLVSNSQGDAKVTFPTDPPKVPKGYATNPGLDTDQGFTIEATVVDDSRREVTGTGTAAAGALRFHAAMRLDRAFVLPGDALQIEVNTQDSGDRPASAQGAITLWRQIPAIPERKVRNEATGKMRVVQPYVPARQEKDGILLANTDAEHNGTCTTFWHPTTAADYILEYEAPDGWGHTVDVQQPVLVYGSNFDNRLTKNDGRFEVDAEHEIYQQGDTARLLVVAPQPNSYVLLTAAAEGSIRQYRNVFVPGRSTIVEIPLGRDNLPNTIFTANLVVNGEVLETSSEVRVAAVNRNLTLSVTTDKTDYKPGERAIFRIHAAGPDGKPVSGEINLGVVDEALLAMEPDNTPDIRTHFYGFKIETAIGGASSADYRPEQKLLGPALSDYEVHPLVFPEGMSWIADQSGNSSPTLPELCGY